MLRTQFDPARFELLPLVIWTRVFRPSISWNLREAQRWNKGVWTFDHCRAHSLTFTSISVLIGPLCTDCISRIQRHFYLETKHLGPVIISGRTKFSTILVIGISLLFYIIIIIAFSADVYLLFIDTNSGLIWVSGKLPTCPSPKQTLTMLAKGRGRHAVSQTLKLISLSFFLGVVVRVS